MGMFGSGTRERFEGASESLTASATFMHLYFDTTRRDHGDGDEPGLQAENQGRLASGGGR